MPGQNQQLFLTVGVYNRCRRGNVKTPVNVMTAVAAVVFQTGNPAGHHLIGGTHPHDDGFVAVVLQATANLPGANKAAGMRHVVMQSRILTQFTKKS